MSLFSYYRSNSVSSSSCFEPRTLDEDEKQSTGLQPPSFSLKLGKQEINLNKTSF